MNGDPLWLTALKVIGVFGVVVSTVPVLVWLERKGAAWIQDRTGPNVWTHGVCHQLATFRAAGVETHARQVVATRLAQRTIGRRRDGGTSYPQRS